MDDEQRYAISPYFDGRIKMNGPYPEITNISFLAKLVFKTFISLKHLSDYRTVGLSDCQTIGLSDYSYDPGQYSLRGDFNNSLLPEVVVVVIVS